MSINPGLAAFKLSFQLSPLILTGGIASGIPGGMLPLIAITEAANFVDGLISGAGDDLNLDGFFANFAPLPGTTLIDQQVGEYPFANQAVAANAVIVQPLSISLRMICPARNELGYAVKLATMSALQATLAQHNSSGGTYTIATPSYFFTNCIMLRMTDTSDARSHQPQNTWQLDFRRPLLTLQEAQQAQNGLMSMITNGSQIGGQPSWSGFGATVGNPTTLAGPSGAVASTVGPSGAVAASPLLGTGAGPG